MGRTSTKATAQKTTNSDNAASKSHPQALSFAARPSGIPVVDNLISSSTEAVSFPAKVAAPQIPQGSPQTLHKKIKQPKAITLIPPKTKPYTVDKQGRVVFDEGITIMEGYDYLKKHLEDDEYIRQHYGYIEQDIKQTSIYGITVNGKVNYFVLNEFLADYRFIDTVHGKHQIEINRKIKNRWAYIREQKAKGNIDFIRYFRRMLKVEDGAKVKDVPKFWHNGVMYAYMGSGEGRSYYAYETDFLFVKGSGIKSQDGKAPLYAFATILVKGRSFYASNRNEMATKLLKKWNISRLTPGSTLVLIEDDPATETESKGAPPAPMYIYDPKTGLEPTGKDYFRNYLKQKHAEQTAKGLLAERKAFRESQYSPKEKQIQLAMRELYRIASMDFELDKSVTGWDFLEATQKERNSWQAKVADEQKLPNAIVAQAARRLDLLGKQEVVRKSMATSSHNTEELMQQAVQFGVATLSNEEKKMYVLVQKKEAAEKDLQWLKTNYTLKAIHKQAMEKSLLAKISKLNSNLKEMGKLADLYNAQGNRAGQKAKGSAQVQAKAQQYLVTYKDRLGVLYLKKYLLYEHYHQWLEQVATLQSKKALTHLPKDTKWGEVVSRGRIYHLQQTEDYQKAKRYLRLHHEAKQEYEAIKLAYLLNQDVTKAHKTSTQVGDLLSRAGEMLTENVAGSIVKLVLGDVEVDIYTDREVAEKFVENLQGEHIKVSKEQYENIKENLAGKIGSTVGHSIGVMIDLAVTTYITKGAASIGAVKKASRVVKALMFKKWGKQGIKAYRVLASMVQSMVAYKLAGQSPISGATESLVSSMINPNLIKNSKYGAILALGLRFFARTAGETVQEYAGDFMTNLLLEVQIHKNTKAKGLATKNIFSETFAKTFGRTRAEAVERLLVTGLTCAMFSGAASIGDLQSLKAEILKDVPDTIPEAKEVVTALNNAIEEKKNGKSEKNEVKDHIKAVETGHKPTQENQTSDKDSTKKANDLAQKSFPNVKVQTFENETQLPGGQKQYVGEVAAQNDPALTKSLAKAKAMATKMGESNLDNQEIWEKTGWFKNIEDGKWRYEISDHQAGFTNKFDLTSILDRAIDGEVISSFIESIFDHQNFYALYPGTESTQVQVFYNPSSGIRIDTGQTPKGFQVIRINLARIISDQDVKTRKTLPGKIQDYTSRIRGSILHELQHVGQGIEGVSSGTSVEEEFTKVFSETFSRGEGGNTQNFSREQIALFYIQSQDVYRKYEQANAQGRPITLNLEDQAKYDLYLEAVEEYVDNLGEREARDTQRRKDLDKKQRRKTEPYTDDDSFYGGLLFQQTPSGIKGMFGTDGIVYINTKLATPDTLIHEFGHIWLEIAERVDPKLMDAAVKAAQSSKYFQEVLKNEGYADLDARGMAKEALAQAIGLGAKDVGDMALHPDFAALVQDIKHAKSFQEFTQKLWQAVRQFLTEKLGVQLSKDQDLSQMTLQQLVNTINAELTSGKEISNITSQDLVKFLTGEVNEIDIQNSILEGKKAQGSIKLRNWYSTLREDVFKDAIKISGLSITVEEAKETVDFTLRDIIKNSAIKGNIQLQTIVVAELLRNPNFVKILRTADKSLAIQLVALMGLVGAAGGRAESFAQKLGEKGQPLLMASKLITGDKVLSKNAVPIGKNKYFIYVDKSNGNVSFKLDDPLNSYHYLWGNSGNVKPGEGVPRVITSAMQEELNKVKKVAINCVASCVPATMSIINILRGGTKLPDDQFSVSATGRLGEKSGEILEKNLSAHGFDYSKHEVGMATEWTSSQLEENVLRALMGQPAGSLLIFVSGNSTMKEAPGHIFGVFIGYDQKITLLETLSPSVSGVMASATGKAGLNLVYKNIEHAHDSAIRTAAGIGIGKEHLKISWTVYNVSSFKP
ncbi:LPD23 domain-containing protein [uncultured Microscilla sp.]|uniref:LPD23 domain-containing protein n=1 Tax=uncultured Microscilla sp. TaxID=432653 RepID=UPI00261F86E1|nr:LPD23 domain-containing protein [uncultured Microscilla sp.]